jgi:hypothetical protein
MTFNPYAAPMAEMGEVAPQQDSPALWNPNAAANWSLLFSPAFGALVQMKNWQALGEPAKAASSKLWGVISLVIILGLSVLPALLPASRGIEGASRIVGLILLITWYFSNGRAQANYVKERFGTSYPRRGWGKPLLIAFGVLIALFFTVFTIAFVGAFLKQV